MAGYYMNGTYFTDVHPPLGKLMIALFGWMFGYDGIFPFEEPGDSYVTDQMTPLLPYVEMRLCCAMFGVSVITIVHLTVTEMTHSHTAAWLTSTLLICDVALITLSRFILLDSLMTFFIFASFYFTMKMTSQARQNKSRQAFSFLWWIELLMAGLCLGCAVSVKFVGIFTILCIGIWTVYDLWNMLPAEPILYLKHFLSRVFCLIFVPTSVYIGSYVIHFALLTRSGPGDAFHTSHLQSSLQGNTLYNTTVAKYVDSNTVITLRNNNIEQKYLHSHDLLYPSDTDKSASQQVTGYALKDANNLWTINSVSASNSELIHHGDVVRLTHLVTKKHLSLVFDHQRRWRAAVLTPWRLMVATADQSEKVYDNDLWRIRIASLPRDKRYEDDRINLCSINCLIELINVGSGCHICSTNKILPEWGKNQHEIVCSSSVRDFNNCYWYIESATTPNKFAAWHKYPLMSLWRKIYELHAVMFNLNSKLLRNPGQFVSRPWHWPINYKPKLFSKQEDGIYLVGSRIVCWTNMVSLPLFVIIAVLTSVIEKREKLKKELRSETMRAVNEDQVYDVGLKLRRIRQTCVCFFAGWFIHYTPFFLMSRVLFFHHYFPAHIFACMLSGSLLDLLADNFSQTLSSLFRASPLVVHHSIVALICALLTHDFYLTSHLCYGV